MHTYEDQASAKNKNSYYYEFITIWTLCQKIHSENIIGVPIVLNQKCISANWLKALLSQKKTDEAKYASSVLFSDNI